MNWLAIIEIMKLVPALIAAIKAIEEAIPESGMGADKLNAIHEMLKAISDNADRYWPMIQSVIGVIVALFNKTGVFPK